MNEDNQNSLQSIKDNTETDTTNTDTDVLPSYENLKEDTNKNDSPQEPSEESENSINDKNEFPQNPSEEVEKDEKEFNQNEDLNSRAPSQELNDSDDDNTGKGNYTPNIILPGFVGNWTEEEKKKLTEKGRLRSKLKSRQKKRKLFIHRNNIVRRD